MSGLARFVADQPGAIVILIAAGGLVFLTLLRALMPSRLLQRGGIARVCFYLAIVLALAAIAVGGMEMRGPNVFLQFASVAVLVVGLVGIVGLVFFDVVLGWAGVVVPSILRDLVQLTAAVVGVMGFLRLAGVDVFSLVTTSAVLTAVIGFALQNTIANVFGGLSLQIDRTLGQGEWIKVASTVGRIVEIGWRSTRVITQDGDTVFVPNSQLVSGEVLNYSRPTGAHRMWVRLGFHYRHPPNQVRRTLLDAVRDAPGVLASPMPDCVVSDFADSAIIYSLLYWIGDFERDVQIDGEVRSRLWYAAARAGLEIPFPIRTVISAAPSADAAAVEAARLAERLTLLDGVRFFAPLDTAERDRLTRAMRRLEFADGEHIIVQGAAGDSLFLIQRGEVTVRVAVDGATGQVATLGKGQFFGEMSLMTGAVRSATCTARSDVTCYVIDREAFQSVVQARPQIAEEMSALLVERDIELQGERAELASGRGKRAAEQRASLQARIRSFFHLD
jgi:small-conductance mechanosensitive channel/CRP-like cAMP-binding protein